MCRVNMKSKKCAPCWKQVRSTWSFDQNSVSSGPFHSKRRKHHYHTGRICLYTLPLHMISLDLLQTLTRVSTRKRRPDCKVHQRTMDSGVDRARFLCQPRDVTKRKIQYLKSLNWKPWSLIASPVRSRLSRIYWSSDQVDHQIYIRGCT